MDFQAYLKKSWQQHGDNPQVVADSFETSIAKLEKIEDLPAFVQLMTHVYSEHLFKWEAGKNTLQKLANHVFAEDPANRSAIQRSIAIMDVMQGESPSLSSFSISDQVRILSTCAVALSSTGKPEAALSTLLSADNLAKSLIDKDPAFRVLAASGNNLACGLEQKPERNSIESNLMLTAAQVARVYWEKAGTWLEVERAEYRLAHSQLAAGNLSKALEHSQKCLDICLNNSADALEHFFAQECFAKIYKKQNNTGEFKKALENMESHLAQMSEDNRSWCVDTLNELKKS